MITIITALITTGHTVMDHPMDMAQVSDMAHQVSVLVSAMDFTAPIPTDWDLAIITFITTIITGTMHTIPIILQ